MYKFMFGALPTESSDREYCHIKGDAGLYHVGSVNPDKTVTLSDMSGARSGETHSIEKVRFISKERMDTYNLAKESLDKRKATIANLGEIIPATKLEEFTLETAHGKVRLREVMVPFIGMGYATMEKDKLYAVTVSDSNDSDVLTVIVDETPYQYAQSILMSRSDERAKGTSDEIKSLDDLKMVAYTIKHCGLFINSVCEYYNPLVTKETVNVIVTAMDSKSVTVTNMLKDGKKGKVETKMPVDEVPYHFLCFRDDLTEEYLMLLANA